MVWAIAILCVSLSCEPIPAIVGWFDEQDECAAAAQMVAASWKPTMGFYTLSCFQRAVI